MRSATPRRKIARAILAALARRASSCPATEDEIFSDAAGYGFPASQCAQTLAQLECEGYVRSQLAGAVGMYWEATPKGRAEEESMQRADRAAAGKDA